MELLRRRRESLGTRLAFPTHGLSYVKSEECHSRHAALNHNHIIIVMAHIPSTLERNGLCREDGKRPDRVTEWLLFPASQAVPSYGMPDGQVPSTDSHSHFRTGFGGDIYVVLVVLRLFPSSVILQAASPPRPKTPPLFPISSSRIL